MKKTSKLLTALLLTFMLVTQLSYTANARGMLKHGTWKDNGKIVHYIKTTADRLRIVSNKGSIESCRYDHCINASFFNTKNMRVTSMAVKNDVPVHDGDALYNKDPEIRGAFVIDKQEDEISVQEGIESIDDLAVANRHKYYAIGGFNWGDSIPGKYSSRPRTALVYDKKSYVYLIATEDGFTQKAWEKIIENNIDFKDGIHLDGGGSTQMKYDDEVVVESSDSTPRSIPVVIGVW